MALPFLNKRKDAGIAGTIMQKRSPDEPDASEPESEDQEYSLEDCAQDILTAIHAHDAQGLAEALKEAFEKLEASPHEEAEHKPSPHSYDAQNQLAGKNE